MKIRRVKEEFTPVVLQLALETQEELTALFCLCNYGQLADWSASRGLNLGDVRELLGDCEYCDAFQSLCTALTDK